MAYRRKQYRNYGRRVRSYGRRNREKILGMAPAVVAGVIVGMTNMDDKLPKNLVLLGATAPNMVKGQHHVKNFCGGVVFGNILQGYGLNIPGVGSTGNARGW